MSEKDSPLFHCGEPWYQRDSLEAMWEPKKIPKVTQSLIKMKNVNFWS